MDPMNVSGLANIFEAFGNDPAAKFLAAAAAVRALWTVIAWRRCPVARGARRGDAITLNTRFRTWRFGLLVLLGMGLAIWGLLGLSRHGGDTNFALAALVVGMYLFTTEPARLSLLEAERRARDTEGAVGHVFALETLRDQHVKLVAIEIGILLLLALGMTVA